MASPLLGIAGVNSLLFAAYGTSKRIISPFPQLSLKEIAAAGALAGAINAVLASPGMSNLLSPRIPHLLVCFALPSLLFLYPSILPCPCI